MGRSKKGHRKRRDHRAGEHPEGASPEARGGDGKKKSADAKKISWLVGRGPALAAVIAFATLMGLFYGFIHTQALDSQLFVPYLAFIARLSGDLLNMLGENSQVTSTAITTSGFSVTIARGCDALEPIAAFLSAVFASAIALRGRLPKLAGKKSHPLLTDVLRILGLVLIGVIIGTACLWIINLARIISLVITGVHFPRAFDLMHGQIWQAAFIVLAIVLWAIWVQWATRSKTPRAELVGRCFCRFFLFGLIWVIMMAPWPPTVRDGVRNGYAALFRAGGNLVFGTFGSEGRVRFQPLSRPSSVHDMQIELENRMTGGMKTIAGDSRLQGYLPTTFLMALILVSPVPWPRRWRALIWGFILINVYVGLRVLVFLLWEFSGTGGPAFIELGSFGRKVVEYLYWVMVTSYAAWLIVPLPLWFLLTFRRNSGNRQSAN